MADHLITAASLLLDEDCNLRCKYCFEKHKKGKMSKEVAKQALDMLCNNAVKQNTEFSVILFGGEPFLNVDTMEYIFQYGTSLSKKTGRPFITTIITNATIMTPRIDRMLRKYKDIANLSVQLSIDGIEEVQNMFRVTRDDKPSFHMVAANVPKFKDIFKDKPDALNIHGCINKETLPYLYENYKFFHDEWGFTRIWFKTVTTCDWTKEDVALYDSETGKIYDNIVNILQQEGTIKEFYNYAPLDRCNPRRSTKPCGAGVSFATITASGDVYPCHQFYFNDPEKTTYLGNVKDGVDDCRRRLFLEYSGDDLCSPECECTSCYRCIAENWCENGSIVSQIKGICCDMSKIELKYQLKLQEVLKNMGLKNNRNDGYQPGNNPNNPDCLCDCRGGESDCECDGRGGNQQPINPVNEHQCSCKKENGDDALDTLTSAMTMLLHNQDAMMKLIQEIAENTQTLNNTMDFMLSRQLSNKTL